MKSTLVAQPETVLVQTGFGSDESDDAKKRVAATRSSTTLLVGTSFKTSSLAFREALAARLKTESARLPRSLGATEFAALVTCNRIEVLLVADPSKAVEPALLAWLSKTPGIEAGYVYVHRDVDAIAHLFRVASGLDSMVLGEDQILAQVKEAGVMARKSRSSRGNLSALFDASVNVGKRVRGALKEADESVSSMALRFAVARLGGPPRNVLLIGTGKTARLAASQLEGAKVYVATRRSSSLSSFPRATIISHKDLKRVAKKCDLIISATKHVEYVLRKGDLDGGRRVVLDLAFPRNVDPGLREGATEVYNLEDLAKAFRSTAAPAGPRAARAEELVAFEAESFSRWLLASKQSSALSQVYRWAEATRREETDAALRRLSGLSEREREVVEAMSKRLVSKLLAPPTAFVKASSSELPQDQRLDVVQRIFEQGTR